MKIRLPEIFEGKIITFEWFDELLSYEKRFGKEKNWDDQPTEKHISIKETKLHRGINLADYE